MTHPLVLGFKQIERIVIEQKTAHEMFYKAGHFGASGMVGEKKYFVGVMETGRWILEEAGYRVEMAVRVTAVGVSMGSSSAVYQ